MRRSGSVLLRRGAIELLKKENREKRDLLSLQIAFCAEVYEDCLAISAQRIKEKLSSGMSKTYVKLSDAMNLQNALYFKKRLQEDCCRVFYTQGKMKRHYFLSQISLTYLWGYAAE